MRSLDERKLDRIKRRNSEAHDYAQLEMPEDIKTKADDAAKALAEAAALKAAKGQTVSPPQQVIDAAKGVNKGPLW